MFKEFDVEVKEIAIVVKNEDEEMIRGIAPLVEYCKSKGIKYFILPSQEDGISKKVESNIQSSDICITFGGDGTLLFASRVFSPYKIPIMGINLGGLGFITELKGPEMLESIKDYKEDSYLIEERMMIDVSILRDKFRQYKSTGLNDLVITSGGISRLINIEVSSGKNFIGNYRADGVIVATPTGSTAYSLSAGGPIVEPAMKAFVISPICPHTLGTRPLVIPAENTIKLKVISKDREVTATVDGQVAIDLEWNDEVIVKKSKTITKLVSLGKRSFYDIVREKLA